MAFEFTIDYTQQGADDLRNLRATDRKKVGLAIGAHLRHEPTKTSRSRIKQMGQPFWSGYRLRVDEFRVYYDVDTEANSVLIVRILKKGAAETPKEDPADEKS